MNSMMLPKAIIAKIKATHIDYVNRNSVLYTDKAANDGSKSWVRPFKKPVLTNHDKDTSPIGRIVDYRVVNSDIDDEPQKYVELSAKITDPSAIEKILDGRFFTVSVGSRTNKVVCSECSQVLTQDGLCEHRKGSTNEDGKLIYWIIDQLEYVEMSFVNEPADDYAGISDIDLGAGWISYKNFLDNRENILSDLFMEDRIMTTDATLTAAQRNNLPSSSFCGPNRSFPAHDKAHVTAGLRLLNRAKVSDSTKAKIKACLYRKGKKYGIAADAAELEATPDLLTIRISDEFTAEEIQAVDAWFKENPDSDLPGTEDAVVPTEPVVPTTEDQVADPTKMKKEELLDAYNKLVTALATTKEENTKLLADKDTLIKDLEDKLTKNESILIERTDEVNKYIDEVAVLEKKLRDSIIDNIIDLKPTDNNKEEAVKKLASRKIESLIDALTDIRTEVKAKSNTDQTKVVDPTITTTINSETVVTPNQNNDGVKDRFEVFSQDRSTLEVE